MAEMAHRFAFFFIALVAVASAAPQRRPEVPEGNSSSTARPSTTNRPSPSIILGTPAEDGEIPFQALIWSAPEGAVEGFDCGGSLIHPLWVLTAAHCLTDTDFSIVELGSVDRYGMTYSEESRERFIHEGYTGRSTRHVNDIALIKLPSAAAGVGYIQVVDMDTGSYGSLEGELTRASGFGLTTNDGSPSDVLLKVDLRVTSNQACNDFYRSIQDTQICTVYSSQVGESTCEGDSGGPLSYQDPNGNTVLVGITSFGSARGCDADVPSVYTRVSQFQSWIQGIMQANP